MNMMTKEEEENVRQKQLYRFWLHHAQYATHTKQSHLRILDFIVMKRNKLWSQQWQRQPINAEMA